MSPEAAGSTLGLWQNAQPKNLLPRSAMKAVFLMGSVAAIGGALYIAWMNRASEKVVTAILPITIAALVAVYLTVLFGGESPTHLTFPVAFPYRTSDGMPLEIPFRPYRQLVFSQKDLARFLKGTPRSIEARTGHHLSPLLSGEKCMMLV